jgi:hypothetical protein
MPDLPPEFQELADSLTDLKVNAAVSALSAANNILISLLIQKNVITRDNLLQQVIKIESSAAAKRKAGMREMAESLFSLALNLRHAFSLDGGSTKSN